MQARRCHTVAVTPDPTRGPLRPIELATGAVLGGGAVAVSIVANLVPFAAAVNVLAAVPYGIIAQRFRLRALVTAAAATAAVAFVAGGLTAAVPVASCAVLGGITGIVKRRGGGAVLVVPLATLAGLASAGIAVGTLLAFSTTRHLLFDNVRNAGDGLQRLGAGRAVLEPIVGGIDAFVDNFLQWWWAWIGGSVLAGTVVSALVCWFVLGAVLDRLDWIAAVDHLDSEDDAAPVAPLPVALRAVGYRYPGSDHDALTDVALDVRSGEFVAIVGHNGSGKSTLTRILAGRAPSTGTVQRPGSAGLGRIGGTAVVLQRPESQILGVLVADDVVWGLPEDVHVDVDALLAEVGLTGLGARETNSLSGGQQQRLAVAAALARSPRLLIADEVTSMVDPDGRRELVALLASLPERHDMAVVLVTHHESEATAADRVIHLAGGRTVDHLPTWPRPAARTFPPVRSETLLRLRGVEHTYLAGTPWATTALRGVDLDVQRGDGILVVGGNGSGKSTLAWTIAGLVTPTAGTCLLDGKPVARQVGRVGLAFQQSRLQLHRRTVGSEIASWGGASVGSGAVGKALDAVGLDRAMATRSIESLSGGQARRVVLAGIMASRPRLVVLDEPLAGLDPTGRLEVVELLAALRASGVTLVVISHDVEGMDAVCSRVVRLDGGRIVEPIEASR